MTNSLPIRFIADPAPEEIDALDRALTAANASAGYPTGRASFLLSIRNDRDELIAGLLAATRFGWLNIDLLWIDHRFRDQGYGTTLLTKAEDIGRERGCFAAILSTFSFQAPEFYRARGYDEFGSIHNPETGISRFYFQKTLRSEARDQ